MKAVIMAGGMGTRISSIAPNIPKPMIPVCGKPILEYQVENLVNSGIVDILIITGYLGSTIQEYFSDGSRFNAHISYYHEREPLGTAGGIFKCVDSLSESFFLINGDIVFNVCLQRVIDHHHTTKALATLVTHPNNHPFDSALLNTDGEGKIDQWLNKEDIRTYCHNQVNSGIHILSKELLLLAKKNVANEKIDIDRDVLKPLLGTGKIFAYKTPEYIKDVGTPDRYMQVESDILNELPGKRNLAVKQKAIFLDRDGTVNEANGFIKHPEEFKLLPETSQAIKKINCLGYLVIIVTNQPVIARGECSIEELDTIHMKMETDLGKDGAFIDDLFYCPHHPDRGFPGERAEYKVDCECRKPKPGMLIKASKKYNIDLGSSWMAGDSDRDIQAGKNAGCKTAFLTSKNPSNAQADMACKDLLAFVEQMASYD